jgi:hypothetical protein
VISNVHLSAAYRELTIFGIEPGVSHSGPEAAVAFDFLRKFGAGEGIRTPDHNLGKGCS